MQSSARILAALLLLFPLLGAATAWLGRWWAHTRIPEAARRERWLLRFQDYVTIAASFASLTLSVFIASIYHRLPLELSIFGLQIYLDALSIYFVLLVNLIALAASFYAGPYLAHRASSGRGGNGSTLFHVLFNSFHFTMVLVPMVSNLVVLWIAVELTTLTSTALVRSERRREALEAAWKYIIITSTGIIFALLGTLFLASAIPKGGQIPTSMNWPDLLDIARDPGRHFDPNFVRLSFLFILVGYGTKAGFAPMHTWLPDGHGEAPYPVSALLSGVLLKSALYAILRFYTITNTALANTAPPSSGDRLFTSHLLLVSGLLSLVVATPFILKRNRFKRVLAYHSLEHMGIITFGIGIGGPIALFGALLHALNHGVTKSLMFLAYGNVQQNIPRDDNGAGALEERQHTGVLRAMPWTGYLLALGGLALVGSPPFNIFYSEFLILWAAVSRLSSPSFWRIAAIVLFLLSVTLIFGGLLRHLGRILIGGPPERFQRETVRQVAPLAVLLVLVLVFGLTVPTIGALDLKGLLTESARIVCGGDQCH